MARRWTTVEEREKRKELKQLYVKKNKTISEIAEILHISEGAVYDRLVRLNIPSLRNKKPGYNNTRNDIIIPRTYSEGLAEFVGILLGDGHISVTQVTVTLGKKEEKYIQYVMKLVEKLFKVQAKRFESKEGDHTVYIGSVALVRWFLSMGLVHNKVREQVDVPEWIFSQKQFMRAALRGLFDTDGSVYKLRFGVQLSFCNHSQPLLQSVQTMLRKLGLHPSAISVRKKVYLTRQKDLHIFFNTIGFSNQKHVERFLKFTSE